MDILNLTRTINSISPFQSIFFETKFLVTSRGHKEHSCQVLSKSINNIGHFCTSAGLLFTRIVQNAKKMLALFEDIYDLS